MSVRRLAEASVQPAAFAFNRANAAAAKQWIKKYPKGREQSAIIPLLMLAQEQEGWVTKAAIETISDMLGMPLHPRARGRDLLHAVPAEAGRHPRAYPGLRHHALHAARLGSADGCLPLENPSRPVPHQRQGHAVVGRGRVPRRLRQRADGDDLQGHVRGSDAGAAGRDHRPLRRRQGRRGASPGRRTAAPVRRRPPA